ncbi:MAG: hypothetical protein O2779_04190 [Nanoarchaeota archaeon]|nr:hypothetical protein [Nanoarchaeota archaeon]
MNVDPEVENLAESLMKSGLASSLEDAIPKAEKMLNKDKKKPVEEAAGDQVSSDTPDVGQTRLSEHQEDA